MDAYIKDYSFVEDVTVTLRRAYWQSSQPESFEIASVASSAHTGYHLYGDETSHTVNTQQYMYFVTAESTYWSSNLCLRAVRIMYTVSEAD
jgi:hypothetical protein